MSTGLAATFVATPTTVVVKVSVAVVEVTFNMLLSVHVAIAGSTAKTTDIVKAHIKKVDKNLNFFCIFLFPLSSKFTCLVQFEI